ncbi:hypothetical protein [Robiginitalea marina]|uniref:Cytochrome c domain-containing protein n=1 Tax=Robiginitalea marina TaxID=2954105 RepID=A0ABT1B0Q1_9FLAO|nr:hypothetical protein [Robiginitalea marina]MCO5725415.1 hypothetical protein [Robiginitalea marina]
MKKKALLILSGCLLMFSASCYYDELVAEELPDIPDGEEISFAQDIEPLFSQDGKDCTRCHDGSTDPDLRIGRAYNALVPDYVVAGDAAASEFFQKLPGRGHPFDVGFALSAQEIALIGAWIDRGAENN